MAQRHVARSIPERINLYQQITDRIIADLEAGRVPWVQPRGTANAGIGMPHNAVSSRRYSGINVLTLWHAVVSRGFSNHAFLTTASSAARTASNWAQAGSASRRTPAPNMSRSRSRLLNSAQSMATSPTRRAMILRRRSSSGTRRAEASGSAPPPGGVELMPVHEKQHVRRHAHCLEIMGDADRMAIMTASASTYRSPANWTSSSACAHLGPIASQARCILAELSRISDAR